MGGARLAKLKTGIVFFRGDTQAHHMVIRIRQILSPEVRCLPPNHREGLIQTLEEQLNVAEWMPAHTPCQPVHPVVINKWSQESHSEDPSVHE
jgi:hypothetical protein